MVCCVRVLCKTVSDRKGKLMFIEINEIGELFVNGSLVSKEKDAETILYKMMKSLREKQ